MRHMIIAVVALLLLNAAPAAAGAKMLSGEESRYPHAIRLADGDILVSVNRWSQAQIYRGKGRSFELVGSFHDNEMPLNCCAHLYELPQQVGDLPKGTLLWAGSGGNKETEQGMAIRIWRSADTGRTWKYLSTCARSNHYGGIWEPELHVDASGRLVCHFADESFWQHGHSQLLARTASTDGVHWSDKVFTVAVKPSGYRPGMAQVRRLPGGEYFMTYEICGQRDQYFCEAFSRTSRDGWDWGDPAASGARPHSREGRYFAHTPSIALGPNGRIVLAGQMLMHPSGEIDKANGARLFVNDNGGRGEWHEVPAPVFVPRAQDTNCPNYHPALVVSPDGRSVLEFASDYIPNGACITRYAAGPLPS